MITEEAFERRKAEIENDYNLGVLIEVKYLKRGNNFLRFHGKLISYSNAHYFDNLLLTIKCYH